MTLTFDDGPSPTLTQRLLTVLAKHGVKAAFFVVGERLQNGGIDTMKAAFDKGHQIGNHSFTHPDLAKKTVKQIKDELDKTQALIGKCAGPKKYFRPPYGSLNGDVKSVAAQGGYVTVLWDVDTLDWKKHDKSWMDEGLKHIKPKGRSIVLNHDIHKSTVDNVDAFITAIRKRFPQARFAPLA